MYGRDFARVTALLLALCPAIAQARAARPDPLAGQAGCERYQGKPEHANDASQLLELRLCSAPDGSVLGTLQTSSLVSGWSTRASAGSWQGDTLILRETEFLQYQPEPNWRFCLIDEMKLERTPEGALKGTYASAACNDYASFVLERVAEAGEGSSAVPTSTPAPTPAGAASPPRAQEPTPNAPASREPAAQAPAPERGCGCVSTSAPASGIAGLLVLLCCGLRRRSGRQPARVKPDRYV